VMTSVMFIASTRLRNSKPYDASRSRSKYRGAVSHGKASIAWRESQAAVGCSVDGGAHDSPSIVGQNDHHVEQPERCGRHNEHIDRSDALGVIPQEAAPVLRRCSPPSQHVLRDGRLADLDAELEQLTVDPGRTPERVGAAHLPNQTANLAFH
jgi:hypothetical protein